MSGSIQAETSRALPPAAIDVMASARPAPLRQVMQAVVLCAVTMWLFGSQALLSWANDLPINTTSDAILSMAQAWNDGLERVGFPEIARDLRTAFRRFQGWGRS